MKYTGDLARRMYRYFSEYSEPVGVPSFGKFARSIGITLDELTAFRKKQKFERAWRECIEIRRDYLIDMALTKRFDSSFAKFLLSLELENDSADGELAVSLEVVE